MGRVVIPGFRKIEISGGGGEGGTDNYNDLTNKPSINNVPLVGNLNTANLKLTDSTLTEEGVPAEAKTVGDKLEEQATSLIQLKKETTINLLNPRLQTTTLNGVTCTNNGDGTYTLDGTAVSTAFFTVQGITYLAKKTTNKYYKLVGCPTGGKNTYDLRYEINGLISNGGGKDFGDGVIIKNDKINSTDITSAEIIIAVLRGVTVNNLVFKPMLTTNLNATYDDFVPYTGDTGSLNGDVSDLRCDVSDLRGDVDEIGITHKHSFFEPAVVSENKGSYTYDFYLKDGYDFNDLIGGNGCGVAMVYINNGDAIKGSYGMLLLLSISPRLNESDMISMIYGRITGPGMTVTQVYYHAESASKKGFRVFASGSPSLFETFKALYTTVASWTNICNM